MNNKRLRIILLCFAAAVVLIPITIVSITGNGFGELISHLLVSLSIISLIGATLLGLDRSKKSKFFQKIGVAIGLLIVLVRVWL